MRRDVESSLRHGASGAAIPRWEIAERCPRLVSEVGVSMLTGRRLGVYDVQSRLGAGGMGEVYRARDTRLGRDVAIKVLPTAFTSDADRLARFEREARMLAALNHPNIGAIYGLEDTDGIRALVLELVDGESLADRIARGGLLLKEALVIARQIADALDAAHEKGIVHRDLKPSNIALTRDGTVKVLDFGLAKTSVSGTPADDGAFGSTMTTAGTREGVVLGTASYMSPEQARGQALDKRTDIWAFGCVLYELLTGDVPFKGDTVSDTIAAVLDREPKWEALPAATPANIRRLLKRCLQKDVKARLRDIGDARAELDPDADTPALDRGNTRERARWSALSFAAAVVFAGIGGYFWTHPFPAPERPEWTKGPVALSIDLAPGITFWGSPLGVAVSPDGTKVAWIAGGPDARRIWVRRLQASTAQALPGTEDALSPFWSSDGQSLGFFARGKLKVIDLRTNVVQSILESEDLSTDGGTWSSDVILFSGRYAIFRTTAGGAPPVAVVRLNPEHVENSVRYPSFLPDGRHFLYVARSGRPQESGVYVGSLDGTAMRLFSATTAVYYANHHLLYGREGALVARAFDATTLAVGSDVKAIAENLAANVGGMDPGFAASANGVLAYYEGRGELESELQWVDRAGRRIGNAPAVSSAAIVSFRLSRDGTTIAFDVFNPKVGGRSIWVQEPGGRPPVRVTFGGADDWIPILSPDTQRVAFMSYRNGLGDIFAKPRSGGGTEEPLIVSDVQKSPVDWSNDGRFLVYNTFTGRPDVLAMPIGSNTKPIGIATSAARETGGRLSPDGHFIVYSSDETGTEELFVQPFPPTGNRWQVTIGGGVSGTWAAGGRELLFQRGDSLMAMPIATTTDRVVPGRPTRLFGLAPVAGTRFDVAPDGRLLVARQIPADHRLHVVLNWPARLALSR